MHIYSLLHSLKITHCHAPVCWFRPLKSDNRRLPSSPKAVCSFYLCTTKQVPAVRPRPLNNSSGSYLQNSKNLSVIFRQAEVQPSSGLLSHESAPCFLYRPKVHSCFCLSVFISSLSSFGLMRLVWCFWVSVLPSAQNVTDYPLHLLRHRYAHLSSPFSQEDEGLAHLVQIWHILIIFPACWSLIALSVQQRSPWDFQG